MRHNGVDCDGAPVGAGVRLRKFLLWQIPYKYRVWEQRYVHLYIQNWNISTQFALELHANIKFNISILASNFDLNFEFLV